MAEKVNDNARRNAKAWEKMTIAQRETGMIGAQLAAKQQGLRAAFYDRRLVRG